MPARRDLHNSRVNFLQRDWGPLEPYDDSMPELLKQHGIYSALISDHYHYWEDGGCTYHNRYSSWISHRGQEGDFCQGDAPMVKLCSELGKRVKDPQIAAQLSHRQDEVNRSHQLTEGDMPQAKTFNDGIAFLESNYDTGNTSFSVGEGFGRDDGILCDCFSRWRAYTGWIGFLPPRDSNGAGTEYPSLSD